MSAADMFWAAPPVTRTLTAAAVLLSVPVWMGLIEPYFVVFLRYRVFTYTSLPQLWRVVTAFILTGPKLGLIMDPYFLYTYGSQLETTASRFSQPGDFFIYLIFVASSVLLLDGVFLEGMVFLNSLTLALAYAYAQENPNRQLTYFIVTFSAKWLPFAMLALTFVMDSPLGALHQSTGLVAAHAYEFLTTIWPEYGGGRRYINTPAFVQRWFAPPGGTASRRAYGTAYTGQPAGQAASQNAAGGSSGWASGFGNSAWNNRGAGRRLGGD